MTQKESDKIKAAGHSVLLENTHRNPPDGCGHVSMSWATVWVDCSVVDLLDVDIGDRE